MLSKIRRIALKQYMIPYIGPVKSLLGGVLFYLSPISFIMLSITTYKVAIAPWAAIHAPWLSLWVFLSVLPVATVLGLIIEFKFVVPSITSYANVQGYIHNSPFVRDLQIALSKLSGLEEKIDKLSGKQEKDEKHTADN